MNKLYAFLLLLPTASTAQPIITSSIQPQPGDVRHYLLTSSGIPFAAGPAQYWDLSGLTFPSSTVWPYALPDTMPGASLNPQANVALAGDWVTEFYNESPTAWTVVGWYVSPDDHFEMVDPLVVMPFPWTAGTTWEDPYSYMDGSGILYQDTVRWTADAWGTVRLPGGQEMEVVGLHRTTMLLDTAGGYAVVNYQENLEFYAPNVRGVVARLSANWYTTPFENSDTTYFTRALDDATIGMNEHVAGMKPELWPVPAHANLNLRLPGTTGTVNVDVFDATGRLVLHTNMVATTEPVMLDVHTLLPGTYLLRASSATDGRTTGCAFTVN
ncbi:MAG: T9SS type A sorting domain-containing protein [Flavobacteriales bacterium]